MMVLTLAFGLVYGLVVGSFLNVCIYRLPRNESIVWPGSHCTKCSAPIRWYDNVPLVSFILLRAKCRGCKAPIAWRYPLVEALGGLSAFAALAVWGFTPYGIMGMTLFFTAIVVTFIDIDHQIIPDEITLPGIIVGLAFSAAFPAWHGTTSHLRGLLEAFLGFLAGGGTLYLIGTIGEWVFKKEAMGGGDVKLLAALGAFLGWKRVLLSIFIASFFGAIVGLALRAATGEERIPFGPYLMLGAIVCLLWGGDLLSWYFSFLSIKY